MLVMEREFKMHENVYSFDVRIHCRIWDSLKHLLQALNKLTKNTLKIYCMDVAKWQWVENV